MVDEFQHMSVKIPLLPRTVELSDARKQTCTEEFRGNFGKRGLRTDRQVRGTPTHARGAVNLRRGKRICSIFYSYWIGVVFFVS